MVSKKHKSYFIFVMVSIKLLRLLLVTKRCAILKHNPETQYK